MVLYIFGQGTCSHPLFEQFFQRYLLWLFLRKLAGIHSFNGTVHFSDDKIAVIQFGQRTFFQPISEHQSPWKILIIEAAIFPEQQWLQWNEKCSRYIFFRALSCQEQVISSYKSFLVTMLFLISYFLKINSFLGKATVLEELFLQNN